MTFQYFESMTFSINPKNPDQIFACLGDYAYIGVALNTDDRKRNTHYGVGVYKSENAGLTWEPTGLTYNLPELDNSPDSPCFHRHGKCWNLARWWGSVECGGQRTPGLPGRKCWTV